MRLMTLAAATAAMIAGAAQANQITIGHTVAADSHYGIGAQAFLNTLVEVSEGAWSGTQAPAGQLGGERDMIEGLQIGSVDMVITSTGPLGNFVPEVFALDLPFLFRDYDHARAVLDGEIGQERLSSRHELPTADPDARRPGRAEAPHDGKPCAYGGVPEHGRGTNADGISRTLFRSTTGRCGWPRKPNRGHHSIELLGSAEPCLNDRSCLLTSDHLGVADPVGRVERRGTRLVPRSRSGVGGGHA